MLNEVLDSVVKRATAKLKGQPVPGVKKEPGLSVEDWVRERLDNAQHIAATRTGKDRDGWLEDAAYFAEILRRLVKSDASLPQHSDAGA